MRAPDGSQFRAVLAAALVVLASVRLALAEDGVGVTAHLDGFALSTGNRSSGRAPAAALWLVPAHRKEAVEATPAGHKYTLLQKDKMFYPHLLIVPVGAVVRFPNADPFFHNVFSLFDGKRFDLGLYEAGTTKEVTFSREGVSYIFCNIHPEMSAIVVSLSTPYSGSDDAHGVFHLRDVPRGTYVMHVWVEAEDQKTLDRLTRTVEITGERVDLGGITLPALAPTAAPHTNKFGERYDRRESAPY